MTWITVLKRLHLQPWAATSSYIAQQDENLWFCVENIYIFQHSPKISRQAEDVYQQLEKGHPHMHEAFPIFLVTISLAHVILFAPQKFILLHKQFWFEHRIDNNKKRGEKRARILRFRRDILCQN